MNLLTHVCCDIVASTGDFEQRLELIITKSAHSFNIGLFTMELFVL